MKAINLIQVKYTKEQTEEKRSLVRKEFLRESENICSGRIEEISSDDLKLLFNIYDEVFLGRYFKENFNNPLKFSLSSRMSRNAGKTVMTRNIKNLKEPESYEIVMAVKFFFSYGDISREKIVNGISTTDALNALQLVFEHELCHLIEYHLFKKSECKGQKFKALANNLFGHTDVYHQLPTAREIVSKTYGIKPGDSVRFIHEGKAYKGVISSINKRATVMVLDKKGIYVDTKGNRYSKWYIPLQSLKMDKS